MVSWGRDSGWGWGLWLEAADSEGAKLGLFPRAGPEMGSGGSVELSHLCLSSPLWLNCRYSSMQLVLPFLQPSTKPPDSYPYDPCGGPLWSILFSTNPGIQLCKSSLISGFFRVSVPFSSTLQP